MTQIFVASVNQSASSSVLCHENPIAWIHLADTTMWMCSHSPKKDLASFRTISTDLHWHTECRTSCLKDVAFLWLTIVSASSTAHLCISYCMQPEIRLSSCQVYCFLSSLRVGLRCWVRYSSMQVQVSAVFAMARYCISGFLILRLHVPSRVVANSIIWLTKFFPHRHRQGDSDSDMGN